MGRLREFVRSSASRLFSVLNPPPRHTTVLLCYHSVGGDIPQAVSASLFEDQLAYLTEHFRCVRVKDLKRQLEKASNDNIACVTFDDGYRDNYERAAPLLEDHGVPATFFIPTAYVGEVYPATAGNVPTMSLEQIRALQEQGHEIGAHSVQHRKFSELSPEAVTREITDSKQFLEDELRTEVVSFAYPYGENDTHARCAVKEAGFRMAVTTEEHLVDSDPDWYRLPRVPVNRAIHLDVFQLKTSRFLTVLNLLKSVYLRN